MVAVTVEDNERLGSHTGPWMGRLGTDRALRDVREICWFTVRDDRIVDWWGQEDDDDRRRQPRAAGRARRRPCSE